MSLPMNNPLNQQDNYKDCGEGNGAPGRATFAMCPHCHSQHIVGQSCPTFVSSSPHQEAWAERFDARFRFREGLVEGVYKITKDDVADIKDFIRQELTTLHKADCERFRGMLEDEEIPSNVEHPNYQDYVDEAEHRNELRSELRTALSKMEEETV